MCVQALCECVTGVESAVGEASWGDYVAVGQLTLEAEACEAEFTGLASDTTHRVTLQLRVSHTGDHVRSQICMTSSTINQAFPHCQVLLVILRVLRNIQIYYKPTNLRLF